jgi:AAA domain
MLHRAHILTQLERALNQFPAVGLIGSRQSGKTTVAKGLAEERRGSVYLDLELPSDLSKLSEPEIFLERYSDRLVILDEIQRAPEIFPILRGLIDRSRRPGRFLVLGSASGDLLRQSPESLAGRITFLELTPFLFDEVTQTSTDHPQLLRDLWIRGGYPESFLAASESESLTWRRAFISTFLERDLPQLGIRVRQELRRHLSGRPPLPGPSHGHVRGSAIAAPARQLEEKAGEISESLHTGLGDSSLAPSNCRTGGTGRSSGLGSLLRGVRHRTDRFVAGSIRGRRVLQNAHR